MRHRIRVMNPCTINLGKFPRRIQTDLSRSYHCTHVNLLLSLAMHARVLKLSSCERHINRRSVSLQIILCSRCLRLHPRPRSANQTSADSFTNIIVRWQMSRYRFVMPLDNACDIVASQLQDDFGHRFSRQKAYTLRDTEDETGLVLGHVIFESLATSLDSSSCQCTPDNRVLSRGPSRRLVSDASQTDTNDTSPNDHKSRPTLSIVQWWTTIEWIGRRIASRQDRQTWIFQRASTFATHRFTRISLRVLCFDSIFMARSQATWLMFMMNNTLNGDHIHYTVIITRTSYPDLF